MTNTSQELSPEALKAADKIQKLLNLAAKAGTPEEAAAATAKAQELLAQHNLDVGTVENATGLDGKREESKVEGGFYEHQRDLWRAVAQLNFCLYWNQRYVYQGRGRVYNVPGDRTSGTSTIEKRMLGRRHAVVGRVVNVRATIAMATYLDQTIERLLKERLGDQAGHHFSNWAVSFRKGAAAEIITKIYERRHELLEAERRRQADVAQRAGTSTATALTLATLTEREHDANIDFTCGAGTSARWAAERAEKAQRAQEREASYARWAAAHPEEARKKEQERAAKEQAQARRASRRDRTDYGAYFAGQDAAKHVGLDPQVRTKDHLKLGSK